MDWPGFDVGNLGGIVELTERVRQALTLPNQYVLLGDGGDCGVVLMDTGTLNADGEARIGWLGDYDVGRLGTGEPLSGDGDWYESYADFIHAQVDELKEEASGENAV